MRGRKKNPHHLSSRRYAQEEPLVRHFLRTDRTGTWLEVFLAVLLLHIFSVAKDVLSNPTLSPQMQLLYIGMDVGTMMLGSLLLFRLHARKRRRLLYAMGRSQNTRLIPFLSRTLAAEDHRERDCAAVALCNLLPLLEEEEVTLAEPICANLHRALGRHDTLFDLVAIRNFERQQDIEAIPFLERLLASVPPLEVRRALQNALTLLKQRREALRFEQTLLRPADSMGNIQTLLRPVSEQNPQAAEQLLRAVSSGNSSQDHSLEGDIPQFCSCLVSHLDNFTGSFQPPLQPDTLHETISD